MPDGRTFLASARSLYFAFQDNKLQPHQHKLVGAALESLKRTDKRSWSVLNDAYVLGKEDVNWVDEERAACGVLLISSALLASLIFQTSPLTPQRKQNVSAPNGVTSLAVPATPLTPDQYKQYALQDPGFIGLQSALKGNEDAYRAAIRGGINSGVVSLGAAPTDSSLSGYLDDGTAAAAAANPLSTNAGLTTQHATNVRSIGNNLAARGGYDSGELTYGLQNETMRDTQARADAMSKFLTYANGLFGQLGSMQAGDAAQLGTELGNAAMRQLALHPGSTVSAVWDDARGAYIDAQGNAYDQWGNHITSGPGPTTNFGNGLGPSTPTNPTEWQQGVIGGFPAGTPSVVNFADLVNANAANTGATYGNGPNAPYVPPDQPIITRGAGPRLS